MTRTSPTRCAGIHRPIGVQVATVPEVREALRQLQLDFRRPRPGGRWRDMGTGHLPWSAAQGLLTASSLTRADRRHKQLMAKGISANIESFSVTIWRRVMPGQNPADIAPDSRAGRATARQLGADHRAIEGSGAELVGRTLALQAHGLRQQRVVAFGLPPRVRARRPSLPSFTDSSWTSVQPRAAMFQPNPQQLLHADVPATRHHRNLNHVQTQARFRRRILRRHVRGIAQAGPICAPAK